MLRHILSLLLLVLLDTHLVQLQNVRLLARGSSEHKPVFNCIKTPSLGMLLNLGILDPALAVPAEGCSILLKQHFLGCSRCFIHLILLEH